MNWQAIGAIGEIMGVMAVFLSLIYLGIQIKTMRDSLRDRMTEGGLPDVFAIPTI